MQKIQTRTTLENNAFPALGRGRSVQANPCYFIFGWKTRCCLADLLPDTTLYVFLAFVPFPVLGVHNGRVLSTDVGGPQVDVRGPDRDFEAEQPDGD